MSPNIEAYFVIRVMRVIEMLAFGPQSVAQVAAELQVHERTARRILARLLEEDYVTRLDERRRRYTLTLRVIALASHALARHPLARAAASVVAELRTRTGLTAHLVSPAYDSVLCLAHADADADAGGTSTPRLRELVPAHCTAGGKALLAARDLWRERVLSHPLDAYTDRTITDPRDFEHEAATIHERGYAIEDGEYQPDVQAVAAAVYDHSGTAVAAIGVSTTDRLDVETTSAHVTRAAATLNTTLASPDTRPATHQ